jgi:hypothetical protein
MWAAEDMLCLYCSLEPITAQSVKLRDKRQTDEKSGSDSEEGHEVFLFSTAFIQNLRPTQPHTQRLPAAILPGIKRPGREADRSTVAVTSTPTYVLIAWRLISRKHGDSFTVIISLLKIKFKRVMDRSVCYAISYRAEEELHKENEYHISFKKTQLASLRQN